MDGKLILKGLIEVYQNDFCCGYEGEDKGELKPIIQEFIIEVTRYVNELRYCNKKECGCSPEYSIRRMMNTYDDKFDQVLFKPHGLTDVNMLKVKKILKEL